MNKQLTVAQQGYEGSYHDIVRMHRYPDSTMLGLDSFHDVVEAVESRQADIGIMAVENSVYGDTPAALELRRNFNQLVVIGEATLDITHRLLGAPDARIEEIRSHPVAIGQCRQRIKQLYPKAKVVETNDTATVANEVAELIGEGNTSVAAIASRMAGKMHPELTEIEKDMNDHDHNQTRFLVLGHEYVYSRAGSEEAEKTTARLLIPDREDALFDAMSILRQFGISYTSLIANAFRFDSRAGQVVVPIEFTHPWHDDKVIEAEIALKSLGIKLKNLGSYKTGEILKV